MNFCEKHKLNCEILVCLKCQTDQEQLILNLKEEVLDWKNAWYLQRQLTGKNYWDVPPAVYLKLIPERIKVLTENYLYLQNLLYLFEFCKLLEILK